MLKAWLCECKLVSTGSSAFPSFSSLSLSRSAGSFLFLIFELNARPSVAAGVLRAAFSEIQREETNGRIACTLGRALRQKTTRGRLALELHRRIRGGVKELLGFFFLFFPKTPERALKAESRNEVAPAPASVLKVFISGGQPRRSSRPPSAKARLLNA